MNYSELKFLADKKFDSLDEFSKQIGISYNGLMRGIKNHTLPEKNIEQICKLLGITPNEFFGWSEEDKGTIVAHHIGGNNEQNGGAALAILSAQLKEKDRQIERLIRALGGTESAQKRGKK